MASPFDAEEGWWARGGAPQLPTDNTVALLSQQGQARQQQAQALTQAQVDSTRNLGDIRGETLPNAVKMFWQGSEEARRGQQADTAQQEAQQRMELAKSAEGRAAASEGRNAQRFGWESEEQPLKQAQLKQTNDLGAVKLKDAQAEEAYANASDQPGGPTHREQGYKTAAERAQLENTLTKTQIGATQTAAAIATRNDMESHFQADAERLANTPDPQGAVKELLNSPQYAKIPQSRRELIAQDALTRGAITRTNAQNQADMTWEVTGPGQDFHEANRTMARTERLAQLLQEKGNVHAQYAMAGGNLEPEEAKAARAEAAATLRKMGDETGAKEVEGFISPGTSVKTVINRVAARKLEEAAAATEAEISGLNPADQNRPNVRQAAQKAQDLRARAQQLREEAGIPEKPSLLAPGYQRKSSGGGAAAAGFAGPPPTAVQRTSAPPAGAGAGPPPDEDPLGLFPGRGR